LKKYLKIQEESKMKIQYNILYDKIMGHSEKIIDIICDFEECILSNLLLSIYKINKKYLNKNTIIEELNNYCKRIKKDFDEDRDLEWASFLSKTREPFDEIILPNITTKSIIKLFSLKNENDEDDEGIYSISLINNKKFEFYKQINELLKKHEYTKNICLTIQTIFEIVMITIYKNEKYIKNVEVIQKIFNENFIEKIKKKEEVDIIKVIEEIKEKIISNSDDHKKLLNFMIDLFPCLLSIEEKVGKNNNTKENIDKKEEDEENFNVSITKITVEKTKEILMDDIFFIKDSNWKNNIKCKSEYKKYPSLLYFLFKNPGCEKELREYLSKTDSIKEDDHEKFPTFLLILRIFSAQNCLDLQINTDSYLGTIIKEEILNRMKNKENEFQKSPDINWLGLLINNSEVNKYLSPKMNYIYNYIENISNYSFKPDEENKEHYKNIIHKMIDILFRIIFEGKLDSLFSEQILKIKEEENNEKLSDILYFTKLPDIIEMNFQQEKKIFEKNFFDNFEENIINIKNVFDKNHDLYENFIKSIENDTKEEKKKE
jgi:hypothetical protein